MLHRCHPVCDWTEAGHLIPSQPIQWLPSSQVISPLEKCELTGSFSQRSPDTASGLAAKLAGYKMKKQRKSTDEENASDTQKQKQETGRPLRAWGGCGFGFPVALQASMWWQ